MTYTRQEIARIRNWAKARLMGMTFDINAFSKSEVSVIKDIFLLKDVLISNWDKNSVEEMGMNVKPKKPREYD